MYCKYCGNKIDDDSIFCSFCGKGLSSQNNKDLKQASDCSSNPSNNGIANVEAVSGNHKKEREKITVVDKNGKERTGEVLLDIHLDSTSKDYVIYTFGEVDNDELETIYTSTIVNINGEEVLDDVETDEEWEEIQKIMQEEIKKNS